MKTFVPLFLSAAVVSAVLTARADATRSGRENALAQLKQMKVADGLEAKLFALEPMVVNPANLDIDAAGRVWVTEGANYRLFQKWGKLRPEGDRIQVLEDTNGDGEADKATTFYQGDEVNTALGICVLGDKVIVSRSPNVLLFEDKNGDLKADGPPKIIFSGIKGVDHDHGVHAFVFGPDGKLYFNMGNDGKELHTPDGKLVVDAEGNEVITKGKPYRQGLAFRLNEDFTGVEVLGHNFRNNYELTVDSFGTVWQSDNDDDGNQGVRINYVMEHGNYGFTDEMTGAGWGQKRTGWESEVPKRHWHLNDPGVVPNLLQTGAGSPTGITIYEGRLLPAIFRNQLIHCDAGPRVVRAYPATKSGAGYEATMKDILTSEDSWFRPSDVGVAPDGSLFVADWNDAGVGGHYMADQKLETMTGRIYRVAPPSHKAAVAKLDLKSAKGAVAALQSPNQATRYLAWHALRGMGGKAEGELKKLWDKSDPQMRARALHLLARIDAKKSAEWTGKALKDTDSDLRITGLRIARERGLDVIPVVKQLANDPSAQVRREAALALRHSAAPEAPALWAKLAQQHDGKDRWYLEALGIAADKQWDAYLLAWQKAVGDQWNTPAGRDIVWRSRAKATPDLLVKLINDQATTEADRNRYLRSLDFITGPEKDAALLQLLTSSAK
jgi:putative membrane-bound dehydrogenase-like protein